MVDRSRKIVNAYTGADLDLEYLTLKDASARIQELIARYGEDANIKMRSEPYSDSEYLGIYAARAETDQEMARRIAQEEKWAKEQEERDRRDFERLSAKFNKG